MQCLYLELTIGQNSDGRCGRVGLEWRALGLWGARGKGKLRRRIAQPLAPVNGASEASGRRFYQWTANLWRRRTHGVTAEHRTPAIDVSRFFGRANRKCQHLQEKQVLRSKEEASQLAGRECVAACCEGYLAAYNVLYFYLNTHLYSSVRIKAHTYLQN